MADSPQDEGEQKRFTGFRSLWSAIECRRNIFAFWIFGLGTNFVFIIALSAANDILDTKEDIIQRNGDGMQNTSQKDYNKTSKDADEDEHVLFCNPAGTGVVLLCSILPELILKIAVQFTPKDISYCFKVGATVISGAASFILFAFGHAVWIRLVGVVFSGIAFGLGETTFVPLTTFYEKSTVSSWSSGTGAAGLTATLVYAGLTSIGVPTQVFMLAMLAVPLAMAVTYICVLKPDVSDSDSTTDLENKSLVKKSDSSESLTFKERIRRVPSLLKYILSLSVSYLTVYFINQGLTELLYFNGQIISRKEQYRWYQFVYRSGVFIARMGLKSLIVKSLLVPPLLLCGIVTVLMCQLFYRFIPYLWIIMVLVFAEGFINGVSYVSVFMNAAESFESAEKEFTLGVVTLSGPIGIFLAGVAATPFHNFVCSLGLRI